MTVNYPSHNDTIKANIIGLVKVLEKIKSNGRDSRNFMENFTDSVEGSSSGKNRLRKIQARQYMDSLRKSGCGFGNLYDEDTTLEHAIYLLKASYSEAFGAFPEDRMEKVAEDTSTRATKIL